MGNPSRCPVCNRFGTAELDGYCKVCYVEQSPKNNKIQQIKRYAKTNPKIVNGALLEVGAQRVSDLKPEDYNQVFNIIKRRLPVNRIGNIVKDATPMEGYGYEFRNEKDKYSMEKEVCNYERLE